MTLAIAASVSKWMGSRKTSPVKVSVGFAQFASCLWPFFIIFDSGIVGVVGLCEVL